MALFPRRPIRRTRTGTYRLDLGDDVRAVLATLAPQLREALADADSPGLRRLFPPAFTRDEDAERQAEYTRLMRDDLAASHGGALEVLARTAGADELSGEELDAWMRALNQLRLALGTRLDVTEDDGPGNDEDPDHQLYYFLGYLQEVVVGALTGDT